MKCLIVGVLISAISVALVSADETNSSAKRPQCLIGKENVLNIFALLKQLLKSDSGELVTIELDGKTYQLSQEKKLALLKLRNTGIEEYFVEQLLREADIFPLDLNTKTTYIVRSTETLDAEEIPTDLNDVELISVTPVPKITPDSSSSVSEDYRFYRGLNGKLIIKIRGIRLHLHEDLDRLLTLNLSLKTLTKIVDDMREYGLSYVYDTKKNAFKPRKLENPSRKRTCLCPEPSKKIHVQGYTYSLPEDWARIKVDIEYGHVYRALVNLELKALNITMPRDIANLKESWHTIYVSKNFSNAQESQITIGYGRQLYQLPKNKKRFEKMLKTDPFSVEKVRDALDRAGIICRRNQTKFFIQTPSKEIELSGLPVPIWHPRLVFTQSNFVHVRVGNKEYRLPRDRHVLGNDLATRKVLLQDAIEGFAEAGVQTKFHEAKKQFVILLPPTKIKINLALETNGLIAQPARTTMSGIYNYTLYLHFHEGIKTIKIPSQIEALNSYLRSGKIDLDTVIRNFDRLGIYNNFKNHDPQSYFIKIKDKRYNLSRPAKVQDHVPVTHSNVVRKNSTPKKR